MKLITDICDVETLTGINVGTDPIDLTKYLEIEAGMPRELRPVELYLKEEGAIKGTPSVLIVLVEPYGRNVRPIIGQLSLEMWNKALNQVGYKIEKL